MSLPDPTDTDRDDPDDARLAAFLRADPLPEPPARLAVDVRRRVRHRRRLRRVGVVAAAAAVLLVGLVAWWERPRPTDPGPVAIAPDTPAAANGADDFPEAELLFDPPPVDPLDRLVRQQTGYVTAMQQMR